VTGRRLFWIIVAATLVVYFVMLAWSIPRLSAAAGGLAIFDMRPAGYDFAAAQAFLSALTPEGKAFYLGVQHRLDLAYPALLAIATSWAILIVAPPGWGRIRYLLILPAIAGMAFDYLENLAVTAMLQAGAEGVTPELVARASGFSRAKAAFSSLSLILLIVLLLLRLLRRRRRPRS
jgi:hypothetical protein